MLIALHVGQISFSQDYFKLLSVRKLIQVEMLYPGSVVPLAMFHIYMGYFIAFLKYFLSDPGIPGVRSMGQVEMLYPGSVVPLAMFSPWAWPVTNIRYSYP